MCQRIVRYGSASTLHYWSRPGLAGTRKRPPGQGDWGLLRLALYCQEDHPWWCAETALAPCAKGVRHDVDEGTSSGQPAGVSPVRGDALIAGSDAPVRGREGGTERGRMDRAVCNVSEA
jgi:hypothetical protein